MYPLSVLEVEVALPLMSDQVVPPSVETCQTTEGVGSPLAAAVKVATCPGATLWSVGWVATVGATGEVTVSVAGSVVADPPELVNTARTSQPFSKVPKMYPLSVLEVEVALPLMLDQVVPPSVETCQTTRGSGHRWLPQ